MQLEATHGEQNRNATLTEAQVLTIREEYDCGHRGKAEAAKHGITPAHYNAIGRRVAWSWLEER